MIVQTIQPPAPTYGDISLPGTRLHYVKTGTGPPLIIVPATVSLIRQWLPLAQFMGQRFTSYFFELPGHGKSTPYPEKFESRFVPPTVEAFADAMGFDTFNLMGFSFGGLLALRTLEHLRTRIDKVILLSPCVSPRALKYSYNKQLAFKVAIKVLKYQQIQHYAHTIMTMPSLEYPLTFALSKFSNVEQSILRSKNALQIPRSTLDVLTHTLDEIFHKEYCFPEQPFTNPTFFGMSVNDDLLDYHLTDEIVRKHFTSLKSHKFYHPYHQPPQPPTFEWLNAEFGQMLDMIQ